MTLRPIFYDTETTGIQAENDRVIEIAAYDPVRDQTFEKLINPGMPIPAEASAVHHITDAMVADAPPFKEIIDDFFTFCEGDVCLVAHNNDGFDIHFLRCELERNDSSIPKEWKFFDTLKWARKYRSDLPKHSLQFLREIYGFEANNAHRALDDVIILHKVHEAMTGDLTMERILELMSEKKPIKKMPFGKHQGQPLEKVPRSYIKWLDEQGAFDKPDNADLRDSFIEIGFLKPKETATANA